MSLSSRVFRRAGLSGAFALGVLAFAGLAGSGGDAQAYEGSWCLSAGGVNAGYLNCTFPTFEHCRNESIGNRGFCSPNPRFHAANPRYR